MKSKSVSGSNIVSIGAKRAEAHFPSIARVDAYWEAIRNGRLMPSRSDVDPRGISDVLEFAFILEKVAPGVARLRLAGMHLTDIMGMEVRGMPVTAMFLPEARRELQGVLETLLDSPATARLALEAERGLTRPTLQAQMVLLPLKDEHGRPTRVLGALQTHGTIGRGPRRFRITGKQVDPILGDAPSRFSMPAARAHTHTEASEEAKPFDGADNAGAPLLRLVHNADDREG